MRRRYRIRPRFFAFVIVLCAFSGSAVVLARQNASAAKVDRATVRELQIRASEEYRMQFPKVPTFPNTLPTTLPITLPTTLPRVVRKVKRLVPLRDVARAYGVSSLVLNRVIRYLPLAYHALPKASFLPAILGVVATETKGQNGLYNYNPNGTWDGGVAQVNSVNWALYGMDWYTVQDAQKNLYAASHILWQNYITFHNLRMAFAAYNAGATAVAMGQDDPMYVSEAYRYTKAFRFLLAHRY